MRKITKTMRVSPLFEKAMREKHDKFNREIAQPYMRKHISMVDLSDIMASRIIEPSELMAAVKRQEHVTLVKRGKTQVLDDGMKF